MRESFIENAVVRYAREHGFLVRKVQWAGRRDAPDRLFAGPAGRGAVFIEFKQPGKAPRPGQVREIETLRTYGFDVRVIDSIEKGKAVIDEIRARPARLPEADR